MVLLIIHNSLYFGNQKREIAVLNGARVIEHGELNAIRVVRLHLHRIRSGS